MTLVVQGGALKFKSTAEVQFCFRTQKWDTLIKLYIYSCYNTDKYIKVGVII